MFRYVFVLFLALFSINAGAAPIEVPWFVDCASWEGGVPPSFHLAEAKVGDAEKSAPLEIATYLGENWYGLYMNGKKAGYSFQALKKNADGTISSLENAEFRIAMGGVRQNMHIETERKYAPDGPLLGIVSKVVDPSGETLFNVHVEGAELVLESVMQGNAKTVRLPRPKESLEDAIKLEQWVENSPKVGSTQSYTIFEPMYQQEITATSHIVSVEDRILDGVTTKVYGVKTSLDIMGIDTLSYITETGTVLEDVVAGIMTMRLESEAIAKDVDYSNDVIVSNAAYVDVPIEQPRTRESLHLFISGNLGGDHIFNDTRQSMRPQDDGFYFSAQIFPEEKIKAITLPITDPEEAEWIKPTAFVQSDNPLLKAKALEIIGDERDAWKVTQLLSDWVHANVRSTFSARLTNALEVLENLEGDCTEHSILFIGLARAVGLPAREVAGLIYVEGAPAGFYFHQWAKVWIGEWIDVDPTFNQPQADVTHIKLGEGDLVKQSRLLPIIGNISIKVLPEPSPGETTDEVEPDQEEIGQPAN